jgi:hypothetical protein
MHTSGHAAKSMAANSHGTAMPAAGRRFQKGESGNPSGWPKQDQNVTELARVYGPKAIEVLAALMTDPKASASARAMAAVPPRRLAPLCSIVENP